MQSACLPDVCDRFNNSIDDLTEQQKKMTLYACLAAFGAFLAFTAAVFLPGIGMLVALGVGGELKLNWIIPKYFLI